MISTIILKGFQWSIWIFLTIQVSIDVHIRKTQKKTSGAKSNAVCVLGGLLLLLLLLFLFSLLAEVFIIHNFRHHKHHITSFRLTIVCLTHRSRVTLICVTKLGLSVANPYSNQCCSIWIKIQQLSFKKMNLRCRQQNVGNFVSTAMP